MENDPLDALILNRDPIDTSQPVRIYMPTTTEFEEINLSIFEEAGYTEFVGFGPAANAGVQEMLDHIETFADIEFVVHDDWASADIAMGTALLTPLVTGGIILGATSLTPVEGQLERVVFMNNDPDWWNATSLQYGGFMYWQILHELGHALGLAHPFDDEEGSEIFDGVTDINDPGDFGLNHMLHTVMSYNNPYPGTLDGTSADAGFGFSAGFSPFDIAALQQIYGANNTHSQGDTTYWLSDMMHYTAIWDTGGLDTIRSGGDVDAMIDLRAATLQYEEGGGGFVSTTSAETGGFTIAAGVVIENVVTKDGDDTVIGNDGSNRIKTKAGDDTVYGGAGGDSIVTDEGEDYIDGETGDDFLYGGLGDDEVHGGTGDDLIRGNRDYDTLYGEDGEDRMFGGGGNDTLIGGAGGDYMEGENGNDRLEGGAGDDVMRGGASRDTFVFEFGSGFDSIRDFEVGLDIIDLSAMSLDFDTILGAASDRATGLRIDLFGTVIFLNDVLKADLVEDDFIF